MPDTQSELLAQALELARGPLAESGAFARVELSGQRLRCDALHVEVDCCYAVDEDEDGVWVGWYTPDRWLSESVEADLVHTGDKIAELLEDELVDQGLCVGRPVVQHYRNGEKVFVFRSALDLAEPVEQAGEMIVKWVLAYQACFVELGDMGPEEEEL
ncbi:MAG: hypothetical protein AAGI37_04170 [Planctomycetota bacterium]